MKCLYEALSFYWLLYEESQIEKEEYGSRHS